jgi:hypothetical protein
MYIWLVMEDAVLYGLEKGETGTSLSRGRLAHTNLSGGREAYCGGELWFSDESSFWITGSSGRYKPRSVEELDEVVTAFRSAGYKVASCGWSEQLGRFMRFPRGEVVWGD